MLKILIKSSTTLVFIFALLFLPSKIVADHLEIIFPVPSNNKIVSSNSSVTVRSSIKTSGSVNQTTNVNISQNGNTSLNNLDNTDNEKITPTLTPKSINATPTPNKIIWSSPTKSPQVSPALSPTRLPTPNTAKTLTPTNKPTLIPTKIPTVIPTISNSSSLTKQQFIMQEINNYRKLKGLSAVKTSIETCNFAQIRAKEISVSFNHDGFRNRLNNKQLPYISWSQVTENLAMTSNYKNVVDMWIASPGHEENMRKNTPFVCVENYGNYYAYEGMRP